MLDRMAVSPGRVLINPENGTPYYATISRADNPTQEGTPLNKANLLKDATAALFGLSSNAVPDDVLVAIKAMIDSSNALANTKAEIATGSYTGSGSSTKTLSFNGAPQLVVINGASSSSYPRIWVLISPNTQTYTFAGSSNTWAQTVSWGSKNVKLSGPNAAISANEKGIKYNYAALLLGGQ